MSQLLFDEKMYDFSKYNFEFSKKWDLEHVISVPCIYTEAGAEIRTLDIEPDTSSLFRRTEDFIAGSQKITAEEYERVIQTGIIQDLNQVCIDARDDRNEVKMAVKNLINIDDSGLKDRIQESIDDYYNERVYHHAEQICQHIDGLIELDSYPRKMFGTYKQVRRRIFTEDNGREADRLLNVLIILGRSTVPPSIRHEESETIEQSIQSNIKTMG